MIKLALKSLKNRKNIMLLIFISLSFSVFLFLGVQRTAKISKNSFSRTISGTDLIIGAKTGQLNLILYSVFHSGNATNNISYKSYIDITRQKEVKWTIPISLGDSHHGFRVVGTTNDYFSFLSYGNRQSLKFSEGNMFSESPFDVVIGSTVAKKLSYSIGDNIIVNHGTGRVSLSDHSTLPFKITGILQKTGTPVDNNLFIPLEGTTAIHIGWETGIETRKVTPEQALSRELTPKTLTALYVGLENRGSVFNIQRSINTNEEESLLAILPGAALFELWQIMGTAEKALSLIASFVVLIGLISLLTAQLAVLDQRRREMALLRSLGAKPGHLFSLLFFESFLLTSGGCLSGLILLYLTQFIASNPLQNMGFFIEWGLPSPSEWLLLGLTLLVGNLTGLIPAILTYKKSLSDGMTIRS